MAFTLVESSIGGIFIAYSIITHLLINGKISGMSGALATVVRFRIFSGPSKDWEFKFTYVFGLLTGGWFLNLIPELASQAFNPNAIVLKNVKTFEWVYFILAGILVGFGTQLGSGCTSGHMLCGLARISLRSFVAVVVFCGTCFAWVKILNTPEFITRAYNVPLDLISLSIPTARHAMIMLAVFGVVSLLYVLIYISTFIISKSEKHDQDYTNITETGEIHKGPENTSILHLIGFFNAFVFSIGLGFAGMTKPQKVLGFFDIGPYWDPSLFCIIIFTLIPSTIAYQLFVLRKVKPILAHEFCLPKSKKITIQLVLGAFLFGTGWALAGLCPGPLMANLTRSQWDFFLYAFLVVFGIYLHDLLENIFNLSWNLIKSSKN
eukprot:gene4749-8331_t